MKNPILSAIVPLLLSTVGHAGSPVDSKGAPSLQPCYADNELTVDVFGGFFTAETRLNGVNDDHGWGGGIGVNYFFHRNFGIGVEGSGFGVDGRSNEFANLNAYLRFPIEGKICFAPYIIAGGGWEFSDIHDNLHGHAGLGVDFRVAAKVSVFTDIRYTWTGGPRVNNDFALVRTGVSFAF